jgi:hypothetical protein
MSSLSLTPGQSPKHNPLQGFWQFWFKDLGSVSFLGTGLFALPVALVLGLSLEGEKALQVAALMLNMGIISISCAIAWQGVRLQATEWAALVPHYRGHIFRQMALIGSSFLALSLACLYMLDAWLLLASLGLVVAVSTAFIALCLQRANAFNLSIIIYLGSTVSVDLAAYLPTLVLVVINLLAAGYLLLALKRMHWHHQAKSVYLNSAETGWLWLPNFAQGKLTQAIQKFFMPMNFFIGPLFLMPLIIIPLVFLGLSLFGDQGHLYSEHFRFIYLNSLLCLLLHWIRIMRWRGMQTLYLLPIFDGWQGFASLMYRSQLKLLMLICLSFALITGVGSVVQASLDTWLELNLVNLGLCAVALGLGSASNSVKQIGMVFLGIALGVTLIVALVKHFAGFLHGSAGTILFEYSYALIACVIFSAAGLWLLFWGSAKFVRVKIN